MRKEQKSERQKELDLYTLSWPIFVEMALFTLIGTLGLWMAGHLSAGAVAVFGMSIQLRLVFDRIFRVISMGTSVVVTQHRGAGDHQGAQVLAKAGVSAALWLGITAAVLVGAWPSFILGILHLPPELMDTAVPFMRVVAITLAFEAMTITMFSVLRAFTYTKDTMRLVMAMNVLSLLVSAVLVFGVGPLPGIGVLGLAYGQLASRVLVFGLLVWIWSLRLGVKLQLRDAIRIAREPFAAIMHIGLPSAAEKIGFRVCFLATVAMAGSLGTVALAVHAYAMQINGLVNMVVNAVAMGAEVIVGHHVGAGHLHRANQLLMRALRISLIATLLGSLVAWLVMPSAIALFSDNPAVPALLGTILAIEIVAGVGRTFAVLVTGGLRAAGDAHYPAKISIYINVVMGTGLAWFLGIHLGFGLAGIWIGYMADECLRGLAVGLRWYLQGWTSFARASRRRIIAKRSVKASIVSA